MPNLPEQNKDSAFTMKSPAVNAAPAEPLPGTPGGKMVGYAEAQRVANPDPGPSPETSDLDLAVAEFEKVSGRSIGDLSEEDFYKLPVKLVAQSTMLSTELSVEMKDPSMACRWFNSKHKNGWMVQQALFRGYTPCTKDDVAFCHAQTSDAKGALEMGDLVLLKIPKVIQFGQFYKGNAEKAKYRVSQQLSKPFGAQVPGTDNGSLNNTPASPYMIESKTGSSFVDATEARSLVFQGK